MRPSLSPGLTQRSRAMLLVMFPVEASSSHCQRENRAIRRFIDTHVRCATCYAAFVLTAGEQELFALRGVAPLATTCPSCVRGPRLPTPGSNSHRR